MPLFCLFLTLNKLFRCNAVFCRESSVKAGIVVKTAVGGGSCGLYTACEHLLCIYEPFKGDVSVNGGADNGVKNMREVIFADEKLVCKRGKRNLFTVMNTDVFQYVRNNGGSRVFVLHLAFVAEHKSIKLYEKPYKQRLGGKVTAVGIGVFFFYKLRKL